LKGCGEEFLEDSFLGDVDIVLPWLIAIGLGREMQQRYENEWENVS
jgi:hypothetical protein